MAKHPSDRLATIKHTPKLPPPDYPNPPVTPVLHPVSDAAPVNLSWLFRSWRAYNGITGTEASEYLGISRVAYTRMELDYGIDTEVVKQVFAWLYTNVPAEWVEAALDQRRLYVKSSRKAQEKANKKEGAK